MATVGLKDLFRAPVTENADGTDSYGTPTRVAKGITVEMETEYEEIRLDGDDGVDAIEKKFKSGKIKIKTTDLPMTEYAALLGKTVDAAGVVYSNGDDEAPYFAFGFRSKKLKGGLYRYVWLYKVQFAEPKQEYETIGESIEVKTPEIEGVYIKRPDGQWKADAEVLPTSAVAQGWFNAVRDVNSVGAGAVPASFDKNTQGDGYVDVEITATNATSITSIKNGSTVLTSGTDYTVAGLVATIKKEYLATLAVGLTALTVVTNAGSVDADITISDSTT